MTGPIAPATPRRAARRVGACVLSGLAALPCVCASAQLGRGDLFSNGLDTSFDSSVYTQNFHDERTTPNTGSPDRTAIFGNDYGALTGGLAAPGSTTTNGLLTFVNGADNVAGDTPERVAVNFAPNISVDSTTTDWAMTVNAYAFNLGGPSNTTLSYLAGMSTSATRANWQGGTDTDGLFWSLTTTGQATTDLLSLQGNTGGPPTVFQVNDIDGNPAATDRPTPGTAGGWVTLAVGSHSNTPFFAVRTHQPDGTPNAWEVLESFDNAGGPAVGSPFFGVEDPFNSANGNIGVVFDNVSAQTLRAGDTNFDGDVDFRDAMALRRSFSGADIAADVGGAVAPGFDADLWLWTLGDFDQDRDVDLTDALALVGNYDARQNTTTLDAPTNPLTLVVDTTTGSMSLLSDSATELTGLSITSQSGSLEGADAAFELALAADAEQFTALSCDGFAFDGPLDLGLTHRLGGDQDLAFTYGVGDEAFTGQVQYVPEPGSVALLAAGLIGFARIRRRLQPRTP